MGGFFHFLAYCGRMGLIVMEIGIVGLPASGKSTLFEIMTGVKSREIHGEPCVRGLATVPDRRFDQLVEIFRPAKVSPLVSSCCHR